MKTAKLFGGLVLIIIAGTVLAQGVPQLLNYQGRLTDDAGLPVDGSVQMHFALLDADTSSASVLWGETHSSVQVNEGIYHVVLGSVNSLAPSVLSAATVYLEVEIEGETLLPRSRLTSVAFSHLAYTVTDGAIGEDQLADSAVTSAKISDGTITGSDVAGLTITGSNLANKTVTSTQIADSTIGGGQVLDGSLSGSDIQDGSVYPADVSFNYAGSAAKGGPASDINCSGCIDFSEVSFDYAAGSSKGGPATDLSCADCVESSEVVDSSLTGSDIQDGSLTGTDIQDGSIAGADIGTNELDETQIQDIYVLNSGDTVTGSLGVTGNINAQQNLYVTGNVGVGTTSPAGKLHARRGNVTGTQDVFIISGEVLSGANAGTSHFRGVYGYAENNSWSGVTNNYGVYGHAHSAAEGGFAQSSYFYGLYGEATGTTYGTTGAYGLYATASGADTNWAGYFDAGNVYINNDLQLNGGNMGLGTSPSLSYGILNSTGGAPATGALLYGSGEGVRGALASDPNDHYGFLGSQSTGVEGRAGASDEAAARYGGRFLSHSLNYSYGVDASAYGYSSFPSYGVRGYATNYVSGYSYGGHFTAGTDGTGVKYGVYASGDDYAVFADGGYYGVFGTGEHAGVYGEVDENSSTWVFGVQGWGTNISTGDAYGGYFRTGMEGSGEHIGVYGRADGSTVSTVYGVRGFGWNDSSADVYGGYFETSDFGTGTHYGVYGRASGGANSYGVYGYASGASGNNYGIYNAAGSKNWVNPDPEDPTKSIVYATLEGGENGTYYRGTARLEKGKAVVKLPDHFRKVTNPEYPITVQVTPMSEESLGLAVTRKGVSEIEVRELYGGKGEYEFDYFVQGVRLGYEEYDVFIDNVDYVPFQGNHSGMDEEEMTTQEWYDDHPEGLKKIFRMNGTLRQDGLVNEDLFRERGWRMVREETSD